MLTKFEALITAINILMQKIFERTETATDEEIAGMLIELDAVATVVDDSGAAVADDSGAILTL